MNLIALLLGLACAPAPGSNGAPNPAIPTLAGLDSSSDTSLAVVDRSTALIGAREAARASTGPTFDFATRSEGFRMEISGESVGAPASSATPVSLSYANYLHGVQMVLAADLTTAAILAVPSAAIAAVLSGPHSQIGTNAWAAANTVVFNGSAVTGVLVIAWVNVGWIAQLSLTSSDGVLNNTPWLTGFVSKDYTLGWWDMKDQWGNATGALEWASDPSTGNAEFGILALQGENAGDVLGYSYLNGTSGVGYYDALTDEDSWVEVYSDQSGSLRDPNYLGGGEACWDSNALDSACL